MAEERCRDRLIPAEPALEPDPYRGWRFGAGARALLDAHCGEFGQSVDRLSQGKSRIRLA